MLRSVASVISVSVLTFASTGSTALSNTEKGIGLGGLIGAGVGTAVGAASGDPRTGAVVGGLLGAGAGGWIGNDIDLEDRHRAAAAAYDRAQPARIDEIVRMVKNGQSERVIVNHIRQSRMRFLLNAEELNDLKANGVPDPVIVEMQNTAEPSPVIARELVASAAVDHRRAVRLSPLPLIFRELAAPCRMEFRGLSSTVRAGDS